MNENKKEVLFKDYFVCIDSRDYVVVVVLLYFLFVNASSFKHTQYTIFSKSIRNEKPVLDLIC